MDIAKRFENNPLFTPDDIPPSVDGAVVPCVLNPGVFRYNGWIGLVMRVAERMEATEGEVSTLVSDPSQPQGVRPISFSTDDPKLDMSDPRVFDYDGVRYLSTLSHLRLAWSRDGENFTVDETPCLTGENELETFGLEDCRVSQIENTYYLTYSAVSINGCGVGLRKTMDWKTFDEPAMILPPHNKDCALFETVINGEYAMLHRPMGVELGGSFIWYATSPDRVHWGNHKCIAHTRPGKWDSERIGAGAAPILTDEGWLEIYHGADDNSCYRLGALLLDKNDPSKVIGRSDEPIMEPSTEYEKKGFFGNVVFTNGHYVDGDTVTIYYGASDTVICGATLSISEILRQL